MKTVTAIICHHKGELVLKAIQSLLQSRYEVPEIIVATSVIKSNFHGVKTLYIQGGPAKKRNVAFRFSTCDYIAFFDDDVEVKPTCLHEMTKVLDENPNCGMVFGKTLNFERPQYFDEAGSYLTPTGFLWARCEGGIEDKGQFDQIEPVLAGKSASCMIRKKALIEAGFFDESYEILGEETDLAWRVWLKGWKVLFCPRSVALHKFNTRFKPKDFYVPRRVYFNGCRNYLSMLITNLESRHLAFPLIAQCVVWFVASVGMFLTGKFEAGYFILRGIVYPFLNLKSILHKRKEVQSTRKLSDEELFSSILRTPPISYYVKRLLHYVQTGRHG